MNTTARVEEKRNFGEKRGAETDLTRDVAGMQCAVETFLSKKITLNLGGGSTTTKIFQSRVYHLGGRAAGASVLTTGRVPGVFLQRGLKVVVVVTDKSNPQAEKKKFSLHVF